MNTRVAEGACSFSCLARFAQQTKKKERLLVVYFCDRDPQVVKTVITVMMSLLFACKWFDDNNLVLNPTKCKALVLSNKHPLNLNFTINDVQIPCVDHLELLGVVIDLSTL